MHVLESYLNGYEKLKPYWDPLRQSLEASIILQPDGSQNSVDIASVFIRK